MQYEIEIEFKNLLSKEEFQVLQDFFDYQHNEAFSQKNIYFDTPDLQLAKQSSALRIRLKNKKAVMTLKSPHGEHLEEHHAHLDYNEAKAMVKNQKLSLPQAMKVLLEKRLIDTDQLEYQANLETKRFETHYKNGTIVLDYSQYHGHEDYELEYETNDAYQGREVFMELLKRFNIPQRETPNKIQRAYAAFQAQ